MERSADVLVIGAGPAGLAAAAACTRLGLATVVAAPDPARAWPNTYGAWTRDLPDPELAGAMRAVWPRVRVRHERVAWVERAYGLVDNAAWQEILWSRCGGARILDGRVASLAADADGTTAVIGATAVRARVVVDASGGGSTLHVGAGEPTLFQVAWGATIEADLGDDMRWMDLGDEGSFLYAMPLGDGRVFVEETALVTPGIELHVLERRLRRRLAAEGVELRPTAIERVHIPMDLPVPPVQRVVAFGASAGMIHPGTGYLLPRALAAAPVLARALAGHLERGPVAAAHAAWRALWPRTVLRRRELHRWGAEVVSRLDPAELRTFFASFFALPDDVVRAWLADALPPSALARAMVEVFSRLPLRLQSRVATRSGAVFGSIAPRLLELP